jgi:hypothetical protein
MLLCTISVTSGFQSTDVTEISHKTAVSLKLSVQFFVLHFLGAKSTSIRDCVRPSVRPSIRWSVPHDAITWKTSYVVIASRRGVHTLVYPADRASGLSSESKPASHSPVAAGPYGKGYLRTP